MSHFTVLVIGENPEDQLEPFNENLDVPRYVRASKEQLIADGKKMIERYKNSTYAEYLRDTEAYELKFSNNPGHIKYLRDEFPEKLKWTDEQVYQDEIRYYESSEIGPDGEVYSESNPNSKWDWYSLGGRWSGMMKIKEGAEGVVGRPGVFRNEVGIDQAKKGDIINLHEITTFAVIKDGKWYERGEMGWWGIVTDEKQQDEWENEFRKLVDSLPDDTLLSIYDCHI